MKFFTFQKYLNRGLIEKVVDYYILKLIRVRCSKTFSERNGSVKTSCGCTVLQL
jgi:hypothetical protein